MSQTPPTAPSLLDPNLVNLHRQCVLTLANLAPLVANEVQISIGQAKTLINHAIDACLVFLLKKHHANPQIANPSRHAKLHEWLHGSRLDTRTLKNLTKDEGERLFFDKYDEVIKRLSLFAKVPAHTAKQVVNFVATICQHHLEVLATDGKLEYGEKKEWLELQPIFLQKNANLELWSAIAQFPLTPPTLKTGDIRIKLGLKESAFDQKDIALPNLLWLINLAQTTEQKYQKPLTIGQIAHPHDPIFDEKVRTAMAELSATITNDPKSIAKSAKLPTKNTQKQNNHKAWLISGAVMTCAVLGFGVPKLLKSDDNQAIVAKTTVQKPENTKMQGLGNQDIAVVRVKDEEPKPNANNETSTKTNKDDLIAKTNADKLAKEKAEKARLAKEKAEKEKAALAKAEREKSEQAIKAKLAKEKAEKEKADKEKLELAKAEQAKKDERAKSNKERDLKAEQAKKERAEKAKADKEKLELAKVEQAKKDERAKSNKERDLKAEQAKKERAERLAKERAEKAKAEKAKADKEKLELAKAEQAKKERAERLAKERAEKAKAEKAKAAPKTEPALTTMQVNPTPKIERPKTTPPKTDERLTTLSIQQTVSPAPTTEQIKPANTERKNKNKNNGEPIINQDTIGKLGKNDDNAENSSD